MFGKRTSFGGNSQPAPASAPQAAVRAPVERPRIDPAPAQGLQINRKAGEDVVDVRSPDTPARDQSYFQTKSSIFNALIDSIDLSQLAAMDQQSAREEIRDIVAEIIALKS